MSNPRVPFRLSTDMPVLTPPNGRPLIVHVVVNLEHWPFDQPMPRSLFAAPHGKVPWPDLGNFGWVEYGLRCGFPRLVRVLKEKGFPVSATMNTNVIDVYPRVAEVALHAGWEIIGHALQQRSLLAEENEAEVISQSVTRLRQFTGVRPRGWLTPGIGESVDTPDHLKAAGCDHVYDWMLDDLPDWMQTKHGPLLAMPYTLELNDVMIFALEKQCGADLYQRVHDTVETLEPELNAQPRVLTVALHPHIIGVPHRLKYLASTLDMLSRRTDTVFMTGSQIADWYIAESGRNSNTATRLDVVADGNQDGTS